MADDNNIDTTTPADAGSPGEPSLRDTIADAVEQIESRDAPPAPPAAAPLAGTVPPPAPAGERVRGPDGRFLPGSDVAPKVPPKPGEPPAAAAAPLGAAPKPPPLDPAAAAPPQPAARAPTSWKPGAREHWAKLPPEVQQEVARREGEVTRTMQESHKAREALQHVQGIIGPYAQNIQASGHDALTVMDTLFRADNTLRHGTIQEKASLVADIVKSFGVDITALDTALAGEPHQADPQAQLVEKLRREMDARFQPMMAHFNQVQGARQQAQQQLDHQAQSAVEAMASDGQHEFFDDVRADMADLMDMAQARGTSISLQDAYDRAIRMNPQVSDILSKRAEAERVNAQAAAAQRARRTAASIGGSPAPAGAVPGPAGDNRRAAIEAAWEDSQQS